jgi:hypothetical protein
VLRLLARCSAIRIIKHYSISPYGDETCDFGCCFNLGRINDFQKTNRRSGIVKLERMNTESFREFSGRPVQRVQHFKKPND